jgi:hypothetical protein
MRCDEPWLEFCNEFSIRLCRELPNELPGELCRTLAAPEFAVCRLQFAVAEYRGRAADGGRRKAAAEAQAGCGAERRERALPHSRAASQHGGGAGCEPRTPQFLIVLGYFPFGIWSLPEAVIWVRGRQGVFRLTLGVNLLYITAYKLGKIANFLISATTGGPFGSYRGY